jgi:hypothetical protein
VIDTFTSVMSTKLIKVKWLKMEVTCKDHTLGHGKPGSKGTPTSEIAIIHHCNRGYISTYYLAQLNKHYLISYYHHLSYSDHYSSVERVAPDILV